MEGKIITCCGDCVHYDWKKHKCKNGHNEVNPIKHFYSDCKTLEDLEEHDAKVKADAMQTSISILMGIDKQVAYLFENIVKNAEHYNKEQKK